MQVGVYTLPVLCTLANGGSAADRLHELLGETLDENQRLEALTIVRGSGGVEAACTIAKTFVETADRLAQTYGDRFKVPQLLRDMAAKNETFYGRFAPQKAAA